MVRYGINLFCNNDKVNSNSIFIFFISLTIQRDNEIVTRFSSIKICFSLKMTDPPPHAFNVVDSDPVGSEVIFRIQKIYMKL